MLITQLKGVDGNVYALAQGTIVANEKNKTSGFIYEGATVENEVEFNLAKENSLTLSLEKSSAKNAYAIEKKINEKFNNKLAMAIDTRTIDVIKPDDMSMVKFIAIIENLPLDDESFKKKIIIDLNRETIIAGDDIQISPVTVARNNFTLRIKQKQLAPNVWNDPQLNPGVDIGDNVKIGNNSTIDINNALINTQSLPTVSDLVRSMKIMNLSMVEIIDTLKMIKEMGAIDVEFEIRG